MLSNYGAEEDSWESLGQQRNQTIQSWKSTLNIHWKDWYWNSNTLSTLCEELTHWKRPWCWERSKVGGKGDDRGWDGWMASPTQWTWVWVNSRSWWWTGRPGMLQSMGSQRVGHDWATERVNWTELRHSVLGLTQIAPPRVAKTNLEMSKCTEREVNETTIRFKCWIPTLYYPKKKSNLAGVERLLWNPGLLTLHLSCQN